MGEAWQDRGLFDLCGNEVAWGDEMIFVRMRMQLTGWVDEGSRSPTGWNEAIVNTVEQGWLPPSLG